jgi:Sec-independent protein translocase protein TatA
LAAFFEKIGSVGLSAGRLAETVKSMDSNGVPALKIGMRGEKQRAVATYMAGLRSLKDALSGDQLVNIAEGRSTDGAPCLVWLDGATGTYLQGVRSLGLPQRSVDGIVAACDDRGIPILARMLLNDENTRDYLGSVRQFKVPLWPLIQPLLVPGADGKTEIRKIWESKLPAMLSALTRLIDEVRGAITTEQAKQLLQALSEAKHGEKKWGVWQDSESTTRLRQHKQAYSDFSRAKQYLRNRY